MGVVGAGAVVAAKFGAGGLAIYTAGRVWMHLLDWIGARWDAWQKRLAEKEALADRSIAARLKHLELGQMRDASRMAAHERAINKLVGALRDLKPDHPALVEVADILAAAVNVVLPDVPDDMTETLRGLK